MPWAYDIAAYWYRPSLLEKAGAEVPTTWDELHQVGLKLKKIGVSGYGVAPTTAGHAYKQYGNLILANDAYFVDDDGNPACLSDAFLEGTEFCLSLAKDGIIRPDMVGYTSADLYSEISKGTVAISNINAGANTYVTKATQDDMEVMSPITAPSGTNYVGGSVQSLMMYTNTPNQEESEAFLAWYMANNTVYWDKKVTLLVPLRKSVVESIKDTSPFLYKVGSEYGPLARSGFGKTFTSASARYDASPALITWAQKDHPG